MKFCSNCGAELTNGTKFCAKCGKPINQGDNEKTQVKRESKINKKVVYAFLAVIGIILLIAFGTIFYSDYSERRAIKLAHEKLVADSLEAERQDSIKLAEQKEQERIEAIKIEEFRKKMSFENFLGMLKHYDKESFAQKCGLSLLYRNFEDGGEDGADCLEIVYGYDVEKGSKKEFFDWSSYVINPKSNHACYFIYILDTSTSASLYFQDKEDAEIFFGKAQEYGLINKADTYFIPNKRLPKEQSISSDELDNSFYENVIGIINPPFFRGNWYIISIGLDF